jgi:excisionase family DNA binding protein
MIPPLDLSSRILIRKQEAAVALGLSLSKVSAMVEANEIPHCRIGDRSLRFPVDALRKWVADRTVWPTAILGESEHQAESTGVTAGGGGGPVGPTVNGREANER